MHYHKGDRMNVSRSLFLCIVYFLHSVSTTVSCASSDGAFDQRVTTLVAQYNKNYVTYRDGNLLLYAQGHTADPGYTKLLAMLGVGIGIVGGCAYYGKQHNDMKLALAGIPLAFLGAYATKKFIELLSSTDNNVIYLTFDSEGLLIYDVRCFAWKDIAYSIESVSLPYQENTTVRKIVFADNSHNNLFELYETSLFLPMLFDDFIKVVECYYTAYGKKDVIQESAVDAVPSEEPAVVVSEETKEPVALSEPQNKVSEQTDAQTPEQPSDAQPSAEQTSSEYVSTPLIDACKEGDNAEVNRLLKLGVDVNQTDSDGDTALIMATVNGYAALVKLLIAAHANPDLQNSSGVTALMEAVWGNNSTIVNMLLDAHADVNLKNHDEVTALMWASKRGYFKLVHILIAAGANVDAQDKWGQTALYYATVNGYIEIVKSLLNAGANANMQDTEGNSILKKASGLGHLEIVKLLLAAHADVSLKDKLGVTAARCAATDEIAELIQRHAVQTSPDSQQHETVAQQDQQQKNTNLPPLIDACERGDIVKVQQLLSDGADVNQYEDHHATGLFVASYCGHTEIVKLLLASHADPNLQDVNGMTALMCAAYYGYRDITKLLINAHADVNIRSKKGGSALMLAANWGYKAIVKQLLEAGAFAATSWYLPDYGEINSANKEIEQLIYEHIYKNDDADFYDTSDDSPEALINKASHHVGKFLSNYAKKVTK